MYTDISIRALGLERVLETADVFGACDYGGHLGGCGAAGGEVGSEVTTETAGVEAVAVGLGVFWGGGIGDGGDGSRCVSNKNKERSEVFIPESNGHAIIC